MKTLVIHPLDPTTQFLTRIYEGRSWTVIRHDIGKSALIHLMRQHERIIMLGHGSEEGLFNYQKNGLVINSKLVQEMREKECICIWCFAKQFFLKYKLHGFATDMFISDYDEACLFCIRGDSKDIEFSNSFFAELVREHIDDYDRILELYRSDTNYIIQFNTEGLTK